MFYVYEHFEPVTGEIVYVGSGSKQRAWCAFYMNRSAEHVEWATTLCDQGYTPDQFVRVVQRGLQPGHALDEEKKRLKQLGTTRFNKKHPANKKNEEKWGEGSTLLQEARRLRSKFVSYANIAKELGTTTMTVHRNLKKRV